MASSDSMVDGPPTKKAKIGGDTSGKCNIFIIFCGSEIFKKLKFRIKRNS